MSDDPVLAAIAALSEQITGMRRDLGSWVERVGDKLTAIHDDIRVNYGASDTARKLARDTREEMRMLNAHATSQSNDLAETVSLMQRQIQKLQTQVNDLLDRS